MYRDAQEELKRLEEALLQEDDQPEENDPWDIDLDDAIADIPDLPKKDNRGKVIFGLTIALIALTTIIAGLLIYIFVCHGEAFL